MSSHSASRFYKKTGVGEVEGGYQVLLDNLALRSPARNPLTLPSRALALAIAAEWDSQRKLIEPATMPLMSLAATAVDQVAREKDFVVDNVLKYLKTDTTCFLAGETEEPKLHQQQLTEYLPLLEWIKEKYGIVVSPGFGICHRPVDEVGVDNIRKGFLQEKSSWDLAALQCAVQECKSFVIGAALLDRRLDATRAETVARLEENAQIDRWGFVEGAHDYDVTRIRFRLASASLFADLVASRA